MWNYTLFGIPCWGWHLQLSFDRRTQPRERGVGTPLWCHMSRRLQYALCSSSKEPRRPTFCIKLFGWVCFFLEIRRWFGSNWVVISWAHFPACGLNACQGDSGGYGYFDLYCNAQCILSGYPSGVCEGSGSTRGCLCSGNGQRCAQTAFALCNIIGNCLCQGCGYTYTPGELPNCTYTPNGVQLYCNAWNWGKLIKKNGLEMLNL